MYQNINLFDLPNTYIFPLECGNSEAIDLTFLSYSSFDPNIFHEHDVLSQAGLTYHKIHSLYPHKTK